VLLTGPAGDREGRIEAVEDHLEGRRLGNDGMARGGRTRGEEGGAVVSTCMLGRERREVIGPSWSPNLGRLPATALGRPSPSLRRLMTLAP
jgi:hypothetical protein